MTSSPSNPKSDPGAPGPNPKSPVPVLLPELGTDDEPVRVSAWFVEVGDLVETGEPILEVMVAGVTCDVCSPASGRISRALKDLDAVVLPGEVLAWVEPPGSRVAP